jgi:hypothetical protein
LTLSVCKVKINPLPRKSVALPDSETREFSWASKEDEVGGVAKSRADGSLPLAELC